MKINTNLSSRELLGDTNQSSVSFDIVTRDESSVEIANQVSYKRHGHYNADKFKHSNQNLNCNNLKKSLNTTAKLCLNNFKNPNFYKTLLYKRVPILKWLPNYNIKSNLLTDLMCGFTIGIMNIPQGMAYALLATLNPINGLYVSFFPLIIYALFGTSRHLVISAVAIVSLLTGDVIDRMAKTLEMSPLIFNGTSMANLTDKELDEKFRLSVAASLTILVGLFQILMGLFGLGGLTSFFSDTFISGYTCGSAVHVCVSQIKDLFGLKNVSKFEGIFKIPKSVYDLILKMPSTNLVTLGFSSCCVLFLILTKEFANPFVKKYLKLEFPWELLLLVFMTAVSYGLDISQNYNVSILKNIPTGLPAPDFNPDLSLMHLILKDAFLIAVISISISISLAALFSRRNNYKVDPTQELYALGLTNMIGSAFACFPTAASLSRSSLLESIGGKSQLSSLFSSGVIMIVILWLAPLFKTLPKLCLASIIIVALKGLIFQIKDLFKLWKINKYESVTWLITFLSVVLLDVNVGLFIGIGVSILVVIIKDQFSPVKPLVQYKNTSTFIENDLVEDNGQAETSFKSNNSQLVGNVKIFKIEHSIYFANCHSFQKHLYDSYGFSPLKKLIDSNYENNSFNSDETKSSNTSNESSPSSADSKLGVTKPSISLIKFSKEPDIILDFSGVNYVDTNGIQVIQQIIDDYKKINIFVYIVHAQESFLKILYNLKIYGKYSAHLFVTIEEAILDSNQRYAILLNNQN